MSSKAVVIGIFSLISIVTGDPYIGLRVPDLETKVVGGQNAAPNQFPHQVSLQWGLPPLIPLMHFCGGSLIADNWVVTAGHCIKAIPIFGLVMVKAGKYNISATESTEQAIRPRKNFIHPNYKGGVAPYDIALMKLRTPFTLNKNISPIKLPKNGSIQSGNSILSGWGSVSNTSRPSMPTILQFANLPVVNLAECKAAIESIVGGSPLHETNVCTGPLTGGYSACSGDSGGPLISKNNNSSELIGIVSWGIMPCGTKGAPSVYTRTSAFVDWIENTIKQNS